MQDLNDMVFFAEVAERGGFTAASRALGVPKSRLSRHIAELEAALGVQLLQRSTRRLSLTPAGEIYLRHAREDLQRLSFVRAVHPTTVTLSRFSDVSAAIGAASLVLHSRLTPHQTSSRLALAH